MFFYKRCVKVEASQIKVKFTKLVHSKRNQISNLSKVEIKSKKYLNLTKKRIY